MSSFFRVWLKFSLVCFISSFLLACSGSGDGSADQDGSGSSEETETPDNSDGSSPGGNDEDTSGGSNPNPSVGQSPRITLNGEEQITIYVGAAFDEPGASAIDPEDGEISVSVTGQVDSSKIGSYQLTYTATDSEGNTVTVVRTVTVTQIPDTEAPVISLIYPSSNVLSEISRNILIQITDDVSGVDGSSLSVALNGVPYDKVSFKAGNLLVQPQNGVYWEAGIIQLSVAVKDQRGNTRKSTFTITVEPETTALPIATPQRGVAPLDVSFKPYNATSTAIETYEWDFDGDGNYDVSETVGRNQSYRFNEPGDYTVTLKLTDSDGNETTGDVVITVTNEPPVVSASAAPSNGPAPLVVSFSATASDNEGVSNYEWDFDGDGQYDVSGSGLTNTQFSYETEGSYQPVIKVTDSLGESTTYQLQDIEINVNPDNYPVVMANASPTSGTAPLLVNFSGYASSPTGSALTNWQWDFEGDGVVDFESPSSASTSFTYRAAGTYFAKLLVTDEEGQTAFDVVKIVVTPVVSMSRTEDTIDTSEGDQSIINSNLSADTVVSILIEDRFGNVVRTLADKELRTAGTYSDVWSGEDDSGVLAKEGLYRAILSYVQADGTDARLDLSTSTGGGSYNPSRSNIPGSFSPLAGEPLEINFTLNRASEVTAFIGRYNVNTRLVTFMQRQPLGKGVHTITWNGENSEGELIHPPEGDSFLFGIFGYYLADNEIYLRSGAHVSDLSVSPTILTPDSVEGSQSTILFTLSKASDVQLSINDADTGSLVSVISYPSLSEGENQIIWDGKNQTGEYVVPGRYRLGIKAVDQNGFQSITEYALQQVYY
jgi:PKD repeat protein